MAPSLIWDPHIKNSRYYLVTRKKNYKKKKTLIANPSVHSDTYSSINKTALRSLPPTKSIDPMNLRAMALTRTAFLRRARCTITAITTKIRSPPQHLANSTPTLVQANYYKLLDRNTNRDQEREISDGIMSAREVRKVLRASEMEQARARLRAVPKALIDYSEFLDICCDVSAVDGGLEIARRLDRSGDVIVLGNVVYLRADQVNAQPQHSVCFES